jgi:hypothetical protein
MTLLESSLDAWMCFVVGFAPLWLPVLVMVALPPLLRWDDARRKRAKQRPGFDVLQPSDRGPQGGK